MISEHAATHGSGQPIVTIIIVSYNTCEMTVDCLRSVARETELSHEVIVIDNASSDGSAPAIATNFPEVQLLAESVNHGFARANNLASELATGRYLLLLNPDTVVLDGAIDKLLAFAETHPDARIWGGRTLYGDRSLNPTNCWRQINLWTTLCRTFGLDTTFADSPLFNWEGYGGWKRDSERQVQMVTGCFFLIERAFWEQLGGFDATFVMYGEEADLCRRAVAAGAKPTIAPAAEIVHYVGASASAPADKLVLVLKARSTLVRRYFRKWQRPVGLLLLACWPLSRMFAEHARAAIKRGESNDRRWTEVWRRRDEWRMGYAKAGTGAE